MINRYGFNSAGHDVVFQRLFDFRQNSSIPPPPPPPPPRTTSFTRNSLPEIVVKEDSRGSTDRVTFPAVLGVNLGKNKTSSSPIGDYVVGVERFAPIADYLVVNVSSPNTPGLRDMQGKATLESLLDAVMDKLNSISADGAIKRPPLLVKIAPDLADGDVDDVVDVLLQRLVENSRCN